MAPFGAGRRRWCRSRACSAPRSIIAGSRRRARSRSVTPGRIFRSISAKAWSVIAQAVRSSSISSSSFTILSRSTRGSSGTSPAQPVEGGHAHARRLDADAGHGQPARHVGRLHGLDVQPARLVDVAVVGHEQRRPVRPDQDGGVGAGQPGEIAHVDARGDQHRVDLVRGQHGREARPPFLVIDRHFANVRVSPTLSLCATHATSEV